MSNLLKSILLVACLTVTTLHHAAAETKHEIEFPNIPGFKTLIWDFHTHTVFSDGRVWPTVRMEEARREGLDAIAITDHIEYRPFEEYVKGDLNASYKVAEPTARENNMLLIQGIEITRDTPPGHFNAIFINDANKIETKKFINAVKAANKQGGFVFWNHPDWRGLELGSWRDIHQEIYDKKWLHGIEVLNGRFYSPRAHQWCLDKGLAMLGNSDIHDPSMRHTSQDGDHRALTLVFAEELTQDSIQEALMAARTAAWDQKQIIGRKEHLAPLFDAAITVRPPHYHDEDARWFDITNRAPFTFELTRTGENGPETLTLEANASILVEVYGGQHSQPLHFEYTVENLLIAPETGLPIEFDLPE